MSRLKWEEVGDRTIQKFWVAKHSKYTIEVHGHPMGFWYRILEITLRDRICHVVEYDIATKLKAQSAAESALTSILGEIEKAGE